MLVLHHYVILIKFQGNLFVWCRSRTYKMTLIDTFDYLSIMFYTAREQSKAISMVDAS